MLICLIHTQKELHINYNANTIVQSKIKLVKSSVLNLSKRKKQNITKCKSEVKLPLEVYAQKENN